jgi:hypothetical protein
VKKSKHFVFQCDDELFNAVVNASNRHNETSIAAYIRRIIREHLKAEGLDLVMGDSNG